MTKFKVGVCVFLFLGLLSASLFGYEYIMSDNWLKIVEPFQAASTKITTLTFGDWDFGYFDLALPAANQFYFYGKKVTHVRIHTKGYVTFGFGSAPTDYTAFPSTIPNPGNPRAIVAPFWDDFYLGVSGEMYYDVQAGNITRIEWRNVPLWGYTGTTYTFEMELFCHTQPNAPDTILFLYNKVSSGVPSHDNGTGAVVGIQHPAGTQGEQYSAYTASLTNSRHIYFNPFVPVYGGTYNIYGTSNVPVMTVWRPSNGYWFYRLPNGTTSSTQFGTKGDIPLPGDWNGDGKAEPCVLRPSTYQWFCANPAFVMQWGTDMDIPVPADYDGAGQLDIAVFRPGGFVTGPAGYWYIYHRHSGVSEVFQWGTTGDIPMPADYDGDGKADLAVYRPASNTWFIRKSSNPATSWVIPYGTDGDIPFAGQFYSGTPYSDICVFRPSNGYWFYRNPQYGASGTYQYGQNGDVPMPSDETVGGVSDFCVFRPQNGMWFIQSHYYYAAVTPWGTLGDKPRFRRSTAIIAPPGNTGK
jgi:hypothetical protein